MALHLAPDPQDPLPSQFDEPHLEDWLKGDGSRPLEGEAEFINEPHPPMTLRQRKLLFLIICLFPAFALVFVGGNVAYTIWLKKSLITTSENKLVEKDVAQSPKKEAELATAKSQQKSVGIGVMKLADAEIERIARATGSTASVEDIKRITASLGANSSWSNFHPVAALPAPPPSK